MFSMNVVTSISNKNIPMHRGVVFTSNGILWLIATSNQFQNDKQRNILEWNEVDATKNYQTGWKKTQEWIVYFPMYQW